MSNSTLANDIQASVTTTRAQIQKDLQRMQAEYSEFAKRLENDEFSSQWERFPAMERQSQLGLAIVALGKAYSAINSVHCIL